MEHAFSSDFVDQFNPQSVFKAAYRFGALHTIKPSFTESDEYKKSIKLQTLETQDKYVACGDLSLMILPLSSKTNKLITVLNPQASFMTFLQAQEDQAKLTKTYFEAFSGGKDDYTSLTSVAIEAGWIDAVKHFEKLGLDLDTQIGRANKELEFVNEEVVAQLRAYQAKREVQSLISEMRLRPSAP